MGRPVRGTAGRLTARLSLEGALGRIRYQQRQHGNPFVQQLLGLLRRRLAPNATLRYLAVMHAPGFRRKPFTHILGMSHDMARKLQPQGLKSVPMALRLGRLGIVTPRVAVRLRRAMADSRAPRKFSLGMLSALRTSLLPHIGH